MNIDKFKLVKDLLNKTNAGDIIWKISSINNVNKRFSCGQKITDKKNLGFLLTIEKERYKSELDVLYKRESSTITICTITIKDSFLLYDLIDLLDRMHNKGEINENIMNENNLNENNLNDDDFKNIKLISLITKNTINNDLTWQIIYKDNDFSIFKTDIAITKRKKLSFTARTNFKSRFEDDNVLRVSILKYNNNILTNNDVILTLFLKKYSSLIALFKKLNKKMIGRDYVSPYIDKKSTAILVKNDNDYKEQIIKSVRDIMRNLPQSKAWEDIFKSIYEIYEEIKKSDNFDEWNELLYKAKELAKNNPIGTPRWAK